MFEKEFLLVQKLTTEKNSQGVSDVGVKNFYN